MSEIDFLDKKKSADGESAKSSGDKDEKIIWSEPDKPLVKETPFSWLSDLKRKKAVVKPAEALKPAVDKKKIIDSRREILELIKRDKKSEPEEKNQAAKGLLAGWLDRFKKAPTHKEVLIDYQQIFNKEKAKRSLPAARIEPVKQAVNARSAVERKSAETKPSRPVETAPLNPLSGVLEFKPTEDGKSWARQISRPEREPKESFISRLWKMIKAKIAEMNRPRERVKPAAPAFPPRQLESEVLPRFDEPKRPVEPAVITQAPMKVKPAQAVPAVEVETPAEVKPAEQFKKESKIEAKAEAVQPAQKEAEEIENKPSDFLETNLIKGEIITFFDWRKKTIILLSAVIIPIFFLSLVYFGLLSYQKQNQVKIQEQDKKFNEITEKIKQEEAGLEEITDFQARLKTVSQISANHIYWTNFFKFLEDNTLKDVYYTGFGGDTGGVYSLDVIASKFSNISEQVNVLRNNKKVTNVQAAGGEFAPGETPDKNKVKFTLSFSILNTIFTE